MSGLPPSQEIRPGARRRSRARTFRYAVDGAVFRLGERAEAPRPRPRIRGRSDLAGSDSPLAPVRMAGPRPDFPLLARVEAGGPRSPEAWARAARELLDAHLERFGALLLRGLPLDDAGAFSAFLLGLGDVPMRYGGRLASRPEQAPHVMSVNQASPHKAIPLHNEMSFERPSPSRLFLFCEVAPRPGEGGETPIARNDDWERALGPALAERIERRGLVRSVHHPHEAVCGDKRGRSWQAVYGTRRRDVAERRCRARALEPVWDAEGGLTTRIEQPVTIPLDGRRRWFCAPQASRPMTPVRLDYRDGRPLEPELLQRFQALQWRIAVAFAWRDADLLCLDNLRCQHGRLPFAADSPRRVLVAITRPWREDGGT